jgi:hypothetical protein
MDTLHRLKNDVNGNPRHVVHFTELEPPTMRESLRNSLGISELYDRIVALARKVGGRRFHNKQYGGGVVFQAYACEMPECVSRIQSMQTEA